MVSKTDLTTSTTYYYDECFSDEPCLDDEPDYDHKFHDINLPDIQGPTINDLVIGKTRTGAPFWPVAALSSPIIVLSNTLLEC